MEEGGKRYREKSDKISGGRRILSSSGARVENFTRDRPEGLKKGEKQEVVGVGQKREGIEGR